MTKTYNQKRRILYVASEPTPGTPIASATLFAVGNATLPADSIKYTPTITMTDRDPDGPSLQQIAAVPGQSSAKIAFNTRFVTGATAGTPGPLDKILATVMSSTAVSGTSVTYKFNPNSLARLSIGFGVVNEDGTSELEHAIAGAGPSKLTIKADGIGKPLMVDWEFEGKPSYDTTWVEIDDATPNVGITYVDDNTTGFRYTGLSVATGMLARQVSKFEFDLGIKGSLGNDILDKSGHDYWKLESCNPVLKIDPTKVPAATSADITNMLNGTMASAGMTLTAPNSRKFSLSIPNLQTTAASDDSVGPASTWGITASARRTQNGATADAADAYTIVLA